MGPFQQLPGLPNPNIPKPCVHLRFLPSLLNPAFAVPANTPKPCRNEVLRLRFEVDYLSHGGHGPAGPDEEEVEELEEREQQLEEAEAALQVGFDITCHCCMYPGELHSSLLLISTGSLVDPAWL